MTHPDPVELVEYARDGRGAGTSRIADHVDACPSCADQVRQMRALQAMVWVGEVSGAPTPECLGDDLVAALVEGSIDAASRQEAITHLSHCGRCRSAVASVARAVADPAVASASVAAERRPRHRFARLAIPAAAAAVLLLAVFGRPGIEDRQEATHRAPAITGVDQPVAIAPLGAVAPPESLRWSGVAGADRYRVTLFRADGDVLYEFEGPDFAIALPDSVALAPGASYLWRVEARTGWHRWSTSRLFKFTVNPQPAP